MQARADISCKRICDFLISPCQKIYLIWTTIQFCKFGQSQLFKCKSWHITAHMHLHFCCLCFSCNKTHSLFFFTIFFIECVLGNMTHLSNMHWTCIRNKQSTKWQLMIKRSVTYQSASEKGERWSSVKWSGVCGHLCVCILQALNRNSWINVLYFSFIRSFLCTRFSFFAIQIVPQQKNRRINLAGWKSILCDFIIYSTFVPFYFLSHSLQCKYKQRWGTNQKQMELLK